MYRRFSHQACPGLSLLWTLHPGERSTLRASPHAYTCQDPPDPPLTGPLRTRIAPACNRKYGRCKISRLKVRSSRSVLLHPFLCAEAEVLIGPGAADRGHMRDAPFLLRLVVLSACVALALAPDGLLPMVEVMRQSPCAVTAKSVLYTGKTVRRAARDSTLREGRL